MTTQCCTFLFIVAFHNIQIILDHPVLWLWNISMIGCLILQQNNKSALLYILELNHHVWWLHFVPKELGHSNFGYPVFIKERPSSSIDFLGKYRVTKVEVSQFVWNNLYLVDFDIIRILLRTETETSILPTK